MATDRLDFIYSPDYLAWTVGGGAVRAENTLRIMRALHIDHTLVEPREATYDELVSVHDPAYVGRVLGGNCHEWAGRNLALAECARLMAGGTMTAVDRMLSGETVRAFNPQGAKHHAIADDSMGFCVFGDLAMAAKRFIAEGYRVAVIDWDVHQGNGTESLLLDEPDAMTASVHGCMFGGLDDHDLRRGARNYLLPTGTGDTGWLRAISKALREFVEFAPDVLLVASGADSHRTDPLGNLAVTVDGYARAGELVRIFADRYCEGRLLVGGAGGYQGDYWTPMCWAAVAQSINEPVKGARR